MMIKKPVFELNQILEILPHRPPFLLVDQVIKFVPDRMIIAQRKIDPSEPWFTGHFPQKPIMPGVIVLDALAQTSGLLLGFSKKHKAASLPSGTNIFFLTSSNIKFIASAFPGETLQLIAETKDQFETLHSFSVEALVARKTIAKGTLMLAASEKSG